VPIIDKDNNDLIKTSPASDDRKFRKISKKGVDMVLNQINFLDVAVQTMIKDSMLATSKAFKERISKASN
jgi:hypothetical protein